MPTASPTPTPSPVQTAIPSPVPSPPLVPNPGGVAKLDHIFGTVYDDLGKPVLGARLKIRSLDESVVYAADRTTSEAGYWEVTDAPEGANIEVIASKPGWTTRRRIGSFQDAVVEPHVVDFGGNNLVAADYYISDHPEIAGVTLRDGQLHLTLSEPLDGANRRRLADALYVAPADTRAAHGLAMPGDFSATPAPAGLHPDRTFGSLQQLAREGVTWSADRLTATLAWRPVLLAGARYQLFLASAEPVLDPEGLQMGQGEPGELLRKVLPVGAGFPARDAVAFTGPKDLAPLQVQAATYSVVDGNGRIAITFDQPVVAFDGYVPSLFSAKSLAGLEFGTGDPEVIMPEQLADEKFRVAAPGFRFYPACFTAGPTNRAPFGSLTMEADPLNPNVVTLILVGRTILPRPGPLLARAHGLESAGGIPATAE
ncbi:MAG: hypothetical protein JWM80_5367 [Cyanobacteria bacterium RYN_339]|nr:hypothetical protein [Cyanobacteria bacterium RYN_339]